MKKLVLILMLMIPTLLVVGQSNPIVYGSFAPIDHSIGVRVDLVHGYMSYSAFGDYVFYDGSKLKQHERMSMGIIYNKFTMGIAHHRFNEATIIGKPHEVFMRKQSIEFGFRDQFKFLNYAIRYDTFRHELIIDLGITIKLNKNNGNIYGNKSSIFDRTILCANN